MTPDARQTALEALGYTPREAAFLATAALHSGYFVRRQFTTTAGIGSGKAVLAFGQKLVGQQHARVVAVCHNTHLYHVYGKRVYAAIGEPDSRNRRPRTPFAVRSRLLALDYLLAHADWQFLASARERVAFFTQNLGIDIGCLPAKFYGDETKAARHFVDGNPIAVDRHDADQPVLVFAYVDDGVSSVLAFRTYLDQYRDLLSSLPWPARVAYVASSQRQFRAAEVVFDQFASEFIGRLPLAEPAALARLAEYFQLRRWYEEKASDKLTKSRLDTLRDGRERFRGERFDVLYRAWLRDGSAAVDAELSAQTPPAASTRLSFETWSGTHAYDLFGTVWMAS